MENLSDVERTYGDCRWYPTLKTRYSLFFGDLNCGQEIEFEVDGERQRGDDDVRGVIVCKINITKIPDTIHRDFKNIVCLHISSCEEISKISRSDLRGLERLREIAITGTKIEIIPGDLFNDLVNLEVIELLMNQIKFIGRDAFKPLTKVAYIDLGLNVKINAIFVGDPFKFPDGIDNSEKCESLEQLNKLIAKMKPIGGKRKKTKMQKRGNKKSSQKNSDLKKSRLVDPSKTHFKNGKIKKCAADVKMAIKNAKKIATSKRKLDLSKNNLKASKNDPKIFLKNSKAYKQTQKMSKSPMKSSEELSQSDCSEISTRVNPKMSKSSSDVSKPPSRLSVDSRSSRSSVRADSNSPEKILSKKIILHEKLKEKLNSFVKSRSNSVDGSKKLSEIQTSPQKRLEIHLKNFLSENQKVIQDQSGRNLVPKALFEVAGHSDTIEVLKDETETNLKLKTPQPGLKRPRSSSAGEGIRGKKFKSLEQPRPLPHMIIHMDGNKKSVSLVDYPEKVPLKVDSWSDKVGEHSKALKIVIKPLNTKTIAPIKIIKQGEMRVIRTEINGGEDKTKNDLLTLKNKIKSDHQRQSSASTPQNQSNFQDIETTLALMHSEKSFETTSENTEEKLQKLKSSFKEFKNNSSNGSQKEVEAAIIGEFIEAAKDVIELDSEESQDKLGEINHHNYDCDIEEIELIEEEIPIEEMDLKLEEIEVGKEEIRTQEQFTIIEEQNEKVEETQTTKEINLQSQDAEILLTLTSTPKIVPSTLGLVNTFSIERYKISKQGDSFDFQQIQQNQLPELIHTVDQVLVNEGQNNQNHEIFYQEDLMSSRDIENEMEVTQRDEILNLENCSLNQNDKISLDNQELNQEDKILNQDDLFNTQEDIIMPLNDLTQIDKSRDQIVARIDELITQNRIITNGFPSPRTQSIFIRDDIFKTKPAENLKEQIRSTLITTDPDLIIKINDKTFPVHKSILSSYSEIIAEKLASRPQIQKLEMKFIKSETFEIIRDFMYAHKIPPNDFEILEDTFKQSTMLKIEVLRNLTSKMLLEIINFDNVASIYQIGTDYDNEEMKKIAFDLTKSLLPNQVEKEEQMNDLHILKELVRLKYVRKRTSEKIIEV